MSAPKQPVKYPHNLPVCLQELHIRDIRFELAKEILLSMPDLMNETASALSAQACSIAAALAADAERLGWLTVLPADGKVPAEVTEQIERAIGAQSHAHQIQQDIASHTVQTLPRGFGPGH
jgi:hypothetical protein